MMKLTKKSSTGLIFLIFYISLFAGTVHNTNTVSAKSSTLSGNVVDVGLLASLTEIPIGPGMADGALAAAYMWNQTEGTQTGGFNVSVHLEDTAGLPLAAYNNLTTKGIELIIGPATAYVSSLVADQANQDQIVLISYGSSSLSLSNSSLEYFYRTNPSDIAQINALTSIIHQLDYRKIVVVHRNDNYGISWADEFVDQFNALPDNAMVLDQIYYSIFDYSPESNIQSTYNGTEVEAFVLIAFPIDGASMIESLRGVSSDIPIFSGDGLATESLQNTTSFGSNIQELTNLTIGTRRGSVSTTTTQYTNFVNSLTTCFSAGICTDSSTSGAGIPEINADYAYDAMQIGLKALKLADDNNGALIQAQMSTASSEYIGITGNKTFNSLGDPLFSNYDIWQFQSGSLITVGSWHSVSGPDDLTTLYSNGFIHPSLPLPTETTSTSSQISDTSSQTSETVPVTTTSGFRIMSFIFIISGLGVLVKVKKRIRKYRYNEAVQS